MSALPTEYRQAVESSSRAQTVLRGLAVSVRLAGFFYAVPSMFLVAAILVGWTLPAVVVLGLLLLVQLPFYLTFKFLLDHREPNVDAGASQSLDR